MTDIPETIDRFLVRNVHSLDCRYDCLYDAANRDWMPASDFRKQKNNSNKFEQIYFLIQKSLTSAARCRLCGQSIIKNDLRIGYPLTDCRGTYGILTGWTHFNCSPAIVYSIASNVVPEKLIKTYQEKKSQFCLSSIIQETDKTMDKSSENLLDKNKDCVKSKKCFAKKKKIIEDKNAENLGKHETNDVLSDSGYFSDVSSQSENKANKQDLIHPDLKKFMLSISCLCLGWNLLDINNQLRITQFAFEKQERQKTTIDEADKFLQNLVNRSLTQRQKPPSDLLASLLPFQEEGLAWMCSQENSPFRGGILADEMGMGKTIQMIALILAQRDQQRREEKKQLNDAFQSEETNDNIIPSKTGSTLVVAPIAAVLQWKQEIEKFTKPNSLCVVLYHGQYREALLRDLHKYDVVITTYATVESDFRRILNSYKVACKYCGRLFLEDKLRFHQQYFCGPAAVQTARQTKRKKKTKSAAEKAMKTLDIIKADEDFANSFPTIGNVYKSILKDASAEVRSMPNRVSWFDPYRYRKRSAEESDDKNEESSKRSKLEPVEELEYDLPEEYIDAYNKLIEMGYPSNISKKALSVNSGDINNAINYLLSTQKKALDYRELIGISESEIKKKKIKELQTILASINQPTYGTKAELVNRLTLLMYPNSIEEGSFIESIASKNKIKDDAESSSSTKKQGKAKNTNLKKTSIFSQASNTQGNNPEESIKSSHEIKKTKPEIEKVKMEQVKPLVKNIKNNREHLCLAIGSGEEINSPSVQSNIQVVKSERLSNENSSTAAPIYDSDSSVFNKKETDNFTSSSANSTISSQKQQKNTKKRNLKQQNSEQKTETLKSENEKNLIKTEQFANNSNVNGWDNLQGLHKQQNSVAEKKTAASDRPVRECRKNAKKVAVTHSLGPSYFSQENSYLESDNSDLDSNYNTSSSQHSDDDDESSSVEEEEEEGQTNSSYVTNKLDEDEDCYDNEQQSMAKRKQQKNFKIKAPNKKAVSPKESQLPATLSNVALDDDDVESLYEDEIELCAEPIELKLSPLHAVRWQRIVLDEAHRIKSRVTSTAKAIGALSANKSKWCLTGTPLQNRIGELYSLIRFLRFAPYAYYYCKKKKCSCKSLHFRFKDNRFCVKCQHARTSHFSYFNKTIVNPIKKYGYQNQGQEAFRLLKQEILNQILLRRTKLERAEDVKLPSLTIIIRRDQLEPAERDFYESLYKQTRIQFNTYVDEGTLLHNYAHIFDLISRLRQAVDHPYLIAHGSLAPVDKPIPARSRGNSDVCGLCQDDVLDSELVVSACKHTFHRPCVLDYMKTVPDEIQPDNSLKQLNTSESTPQDSSSLVLGCPVCYSALTIDLNTPLDISSSSFSSCSTTDSVSSRKRCGILSRINVSEFQSSTKIEALFQELTLIQEQDPEAKSIVFSQFTSMLELIEWRLKKGGITCAKLVGSLSLTARSNILLAFNTDPNLKVVLISLKAGGEGLNLQIANNIFLMDPWWNPAAELQAIQRAHRIGQRKPVKAIRFICENTIEEKMLQLQEKKQLVFDGTVGANASAMAKLTSEDLRFLFQN